jgi:ribose transport system substrate-binding protein
VKTDGIIRANWRSASLVAAGLLTALGATACGSSGSSTPTTSPSSGANLTYVNAQLAKFSKLPTFQAPGPAFDATKLMAGKTIFSIPVNSADQFVQVLEQGEQAVAKQIGVTYKDWTNSGSPSAWVQGMEEAVTSHASVIDLLSGINPATLEPQIAAAKSAHIPVVASDAYDLNEPADPSVSGVMDVPYAEAGRLMADWAISDSKGKADVLVIGSSDVVSSPYMVKAIDSEFSTYCSTCKVTNKDIPVADWASETQTQVAAALSADPNLDYILPVYDSQSQFIVPAITAAGRTGKVFISTYDGTPFVLKIMEDGGPVKMDVGEDLNWISMAVMDQDMRIAAGLPPSKNENTPMMIITKSNVATTGTPPQNSVGYGKAYIAGYAKLWGLSS